MLTAGVPGLTSIFSMILSILIAVCSAVIVFEGREYRGSELTALLKNPVLVPRLNLSTLEDADVPHVPQEFFSLVSPAQFQTARVHWPHIQIPNGQDTSVQQPVPQPVEVVEPTPFQPITVGGENLSTLDEAHGFLNRHHFRMVKLGREKVGDRNSFGADLISGLSKPIKSLFYWRNKRFKLVDKKTNNSRRHGWNYLMGVYYIPDTLTDEDKQIMMEWAIMGIVVSSGLKTKSNSKKLMNLLRSTGIFNEGKNRDRINTRDKYEIALSRAIKSMHEIKRNNHDLWKNVRDFAFARIRTDPDFARFDADLSNFDPEQLSDDFKNSFPFYYNNYLRFNRSWDEVFQAEGEEEDVDSDDEVMIVRNAPLAPWVPSIDAAMKEIMLIPAPDLYFYPHEYALDRTIPYLTQDPPRIAASFRQNGNLSNSCAASHLLHHYNHLKSMDFRLASNGDEIRLIVEWAMIGIIFNGNSLPPSHRPFIAWLSAIALDRNYTETLKLIRMGRDANPRLWDALATVAEGRFRVDPEAEPLPLLDYWTSKHKGIKYNMTPKPMEIISDPQPNSQPVPQTPETIALEMYLNRMEEIFTTKPFNYQDLLAIHSETLQFLRANPSLLSHARAVAKHGWIKRNLNL